MQDKAKVAAVAAAAAVTAEVDDDDDYLMTPIISSGKTKKSSKSEPPAKASVLDTTAEDLIARLSPQNVADLVLLSMVSTKKNIPSSA